MLKYIGAILWALIFIYVIAAEVIYGLVVAFRVLFLGYVPPDDSDEDA